MMKFAIFPIATLTPSACAVSGGGPNGHAPVTIGTFARPAAGVAADANAAQQHGHFTITEPESREMLERIGPPILRLLTLTLALVIAVPLLLSLLTPLLV